MRNLFAFFLLGITFLPSVSAAQAYTLSYVYDGDTVKLRDADGEFKLRIKDIDAPERNQAYGKKARRAVMQLCKGKDALVTVQLTGMDKYQRYLGRMQCNHIDVSLYLAEQGLAWFDTKYSSDIAILHAQKHAQQNRIGLWQEPKPTPPWVWRHLQHRSP